MPLDHLRLGVKVCVRSHRALEPARTLYALDVAKICREVVSVGGIVVCSDPRVVGPPQRDVSVPVGDWGGRIGHLALTDVMTFSQAARPLLLAQGMSEGDFAQLVATMRDECERLRYTWPFHIAYGQRA